MKQSLSSSIEAVNVRQESSAKKLKQNQSPRNESYKRFLRGGKRASEKSKEVKEMKEMKEVKEVKEGKVISLSGHRARSRKNKRFTQKNPHLKARKQKKIKDIKNMLKTKVQTQNQQRKEIKRGKTAIFISC